MKPILFSLGPISISSFGFFAAVSFLLATFLIWKFSQEELLFSKTPIEEETLFDAVFIFCLSSLFGARLIYVLSHFEEFGSNFLRWILIREASGFSFLGGFLVGALLLFIYCLKKGLDFLDIFDLFSLGGSAALSFAFIGALLDGVGAGARTTFPWGVLFVGYEGRRHPVQLLASVFFLVSFLILKKVRFYALKKRLKKGIVTFCCLTLLSFTLFLLDFLKEGDIYFSGLKFSALIYLTVFLLSGGFLYKRLERNVREDLREVVGFLSLKIKKIKGKIRR